MFLTTYQRSSGPCILLCSQESCFLTFMCLNFDAGEMDKADLPVNAFYKKVGLNLGDHL